jgi:hypothetical protein
MIFELKKDGEIYMDGTLTEVLCVLDALDDEPKKEPKKEAKTRAEYVYDFLNKYDNQSVFDFFGWDASVTGVIRDIGAYGRGEVILNFSDGSELKLKC